VFMIFIAWVVMLTTSMIQGLRLHSVRKAHRLGSELKMSTAAHQLVLLRHGESTWNDENKFTGWYDCPLSAKGEQEAIAAGKLLKANDFKFDLAYTSFLQRAIKTLWHTLEQTGHMYIPIKNAWQLNERHYGALQGLDKQQTVQKFGKEQVLVWRRSYDVPPPACEPGSPMLPANDPKYAGLAEAQAIATESLKTTLDRVLPLWHSAIAPDISSGKRVVIAAHGNSLRALVKYLDNISDAEITELNIPTGVPLVYDLTKDLKPIKHADSIGPLSGRYIGNQEDIRARILGVANQTK
jgi:2,3-bisphosphoglycerate-dependent phosphoglycerate mutase